jgi:hypothetical protein
MDKNNYLDNLTFNVGVVASIVTLFILSLEFIVLVWLSDSPEIGVIMLLLLIVLALLLQVLSKLQVHYEGQSAVLARINFLYFSITALAVVILFGALQAAINHYQQTQIRQNPAYILANQAYESAQHNYNVAVDRIGQGVDRLSEQVNMVLALNNQIQDFRSTAESRLQAANAEWQSNFDAYMRNNKLSGASYDNLTTVTFDGSEFVCQFKRNPQGQPYLRLSSEICATLNTSYPKPKVLSDVADLNVLENLQTRASQYSEAQVHLNELNRLKGIMDARFIDFQNTIAELQTTDTSNWYFFVMLSGLLNLGIDHVQNISLLLLALLLYSVRSFLFRFHEALLRQKADGEEQAKESEQGKFHIYLDVALRKILSKDRKRNIAIITLSLAIAAFYVGYIGDGYLTAAVFALVFAVVVYYTLSTYPTDTDAGTGNGKPTGTDAGTGNGKPTGTDAGTGNGKPTGTDAGTGNGKPTGTDAGTGNGKPTGTDAGTGNGKPTGTDAGTGNGKPTGTDAGTGNGKPTGYDGTRIGFTAESLKPNPEAIKEVFYQFLEEGYKPVECLRKTEAKLGIPKQHNIYAKRWADKAK